MLLRTLLLALLVAALVPAAASATSNPSLKPSWSGDGINVFDASGVDDDDKLVAMRAASGGGVWALSVQGAPSVGTRAIVTRLTSAGTVDTTWGTNGSVGIGTPTAEFAPAQVLVDGATLWIVGTLSNESEVYPAVAKLGTDGTVDLGWADNGFAAFDLGSEAWVTDGVLLDGDVHLVGQFSGTPSRRTAAFAARMDTSGTLVDSFGIDGVSTWSGNPVPNGGHDVATAVTIADGKLTAVGISYDPSRIFTWVARIGATGELDSSFGDAGVVILQAHNAEPNALSIASMPGGGSVVAGNNLEGTVDDSYIARLDASGEFVDSFGDGGVVVLDINGRYDSPTAVAAGPSGTVEVAGWADGNASHGTNTWYARVGATGAIVGSTPIPVVDVSGSFRNDTATDIVTEASGSVLVGGWTMATSASSSTDSYVARFGHGSTPIAKPGITRAAKVSGTAFRAAVLTCADAAWTGAGAARTYAWFVNGVRVFGQTARTHTVTAAVGAKLGCSVTASNAGGSTTSRSANVTVLARPITAPRNVIAPRVVKGSGFRGGAYRMGTLNCLPGQWSGVGVIVRTRWALNGTVIGSAAGVTVPPRAVGRRLECLVTATNVGGTVRIVASSAIVAPYRVVRGTMRPDVRSGTPGWERFVLGAGDDTGRGAGGDDVLEGARGDDLLIGGPGRDLLVGGMGDDRLVGGPGIDRFIGGGGADQINARDFVTLAPEVVACGPGRDVVLADRRDRVGADCEVVRRGRR